MTKYIIKYYFDGNGEVKVKAKSKEEAKEMFFDGNFVDEEEWGENYNIEAVEEEQK